VNQFLFSWAKFFHWLNFILFYFFFEKKWVLPAFYHLIPLKKEFQNNLPDLLYNFQVGGPTM